SPLEHSGRLVPDSHPVLTSDVKAGKREARIDVVWIARERGLELCFFTLRCCAVGGPAGHRSIAGDRATGFARPGRLVHENAEEHDTRRAADAPEEAARARAAIGERGCCACRGRGSTLLGHRRTSPLLEREQRLRRLQLQRVSLAGELLRISFAGRILALPQLPQKHFALASEIARFHAMNSAGPRRAPWTSEQSPEEK